MELLLWRHAEALEGSPDSARALSPRGEQQARRVAAWLNVHAPENLRLLVSPAVRTRQTAGFFRQEAEVCEALSIGAKLADILSVLKHQDADTPLLLVGHQPLLGKIAARLAHDAPFPDAFKKGALWWLSGKHEWKKLRQVVDADALPSVTLLKPKDGAAYDLADQLENAGKYRRAFKLFHRLAKRGNSAAMTRLALLYDRGCGVKYNWAKIIKWETKVAETGDSAGMFNLGVTYRRAGDVRRAKKWLGKALQAGDGEAALEMAKMYLISELEHDRVKHYLHRALETGCLCEASREEIQRLLEELENEAGA
jgi:phosphohistidine phosphatase